MPCHAAMIEKPLVVSPDMNVEKAVVALKKAGVSAAAVVDEGGLIVGVFSLAIVMRNLLPVSVAMSDGIQMDVPVKAAPGIAKRLGKVYPLHVSDIMEKKKINIVYPQTPIWECVNKILSYGGPVVVVEDGGMRFMGMIDDFSVFRELQRLQESEKS